MYIFPIGFPIGIPYWSTWSPYCAPYFDCLKDGEPTPVSEPAPPRPELRLPNTKNTTNNNR